MNQRTSLAGTGKNMGVLTKIRPLWLAGSLNQSGESMRWNIIVKCVGEDGKHSTITLGTIERLAGNTTAENLGINLQESKQIVHRLQDTVVKQQRTRDVRYSTANWANTPGGRPQSHHRDWPLRPEPPSSFRSQRFS